MSAKIYKFVIIKVKRISCRNRWIHHYHFRPPTNCHHRVRAPNQKPSSYRQNLPRIFVCHSAPRVLKIIFIIYWIKIFKLSVIKWFIINHSSSVWSFFHRAWGSRSCMVNRWCARCASNSRARRIVAPWRAVPNSDHESQWISLKFVNKFKTNIIVIS